MSVTKYRQRGIALMEILITLLVLSIGLLGAAQLQLLSLNNAQASRTRINATLIASDLAERIRANPMVLELEEDDIAYLSITATEGVQAQAPDDPACINGCEPADQSAVDTREWLENLVDVEGVAADGSAYKAVLPNATAEVTRTAEKRIRLVLSWQELDRNSKSIVPYSYTQEIEL